MKKVLVKSEFYDKFNHTLVYKAGAVVTFNDDRAASLVETGLVEYVPEPEAPALPFEETVADKGQVAESADEAVAEPVPEVHEESADEAKADSSTKIEKASEPKSKSRKKK